MVTHGGRRASVATPAPARTATMLVAALAGSILAAAAWAAPALPSARKSGEADRPGRGGELLALVIDAVAPVKRACPEDDGRAAEEICTAYDGTFSALKLDFELSSQHIDLTGVKAESPWRVADGTYVRDYDVDGDELTVIFDDARDLLVFRGDVAAQLAARRLADRTAARHVNRARIAVLDFDTPADVAPPTPADAELARPAYPELARIDAIEGSVVVEGVVGADGAVGSLRVAEVDPQGYRLDTAALDAVEGWRFEPARRGDEPVAVPFRVRFEFAPGR